MTGALFTGDREGLVCGSELGRQVTVDLQADADFNESRGGPGHDYFLVTQRAAETAVAGTYGNTI